MAKNRLKEELVNKWYDNDENEMYVCFTIVILEDIVKTPKENIVLH